MKTRHILLLCLIFVGFWLRVANVDRSDFRGDEAFTVQYWMMPPLSESLQTYIAIDPQPALAYASYRMWGQAVGLSEFAVRMLPVLVSTLAIALMFRFARQVTKNDRVALIATLIWTVQPFLIWHAQDARNYAIWSTLSLLSLWLALRALERDTPRTWIAYVTAVAVTGYVYYLELFLMFALSVYVLFAYWLCWRVYAKWAGAMLTVGAILAPWYLQPEISSGGGYSGTTTGFDFARLFIDFPEALAFGTALPGALDAWLWVVVYVALAAGLAVVLRNNWKHALLLGSIAIVPVVLLSIVTLRLNVLAPRYVMGVIPAWALVIALLANRGGRWIGGGLVAGWIALSFVGTYTYHTDQPKAPDWNALSIYLAENAAADDLVIQTSVDPGFGYYYNDVYRIPVDELALPASPEQPADEIEAQLASLSREYDSLWLAAQGFTDWPSYGVVETWLEANMQRVIDTDPAGLRAEQYMPWDVSSDEITTDAPLAVFGDVAELVDVRVVQPPQPTGELVVWAYWRPMVQTDSPYKVFLHMAGDFNPATNSPLWAQDDREPQNGRAATDVWEPGTLYRDVYTLPGVNTVPEGDYTLLMGMYDPVTGERLTIDGGGDAYTIDTIALP
ncbi:MAG: glycosyltransferase family 39 protein [Chloroflexota bacterium]